MPAAASTLDVRRDACRGGAAGSGWGFRDMGTQWTVRALDLGPHAGRAVRYVVGDAAAVSRELELRVPPAPGAAAGLTLVMCACPHLLAF